MVPSFSASLFGTRVILTAVALDALLKRRQLRQCNRSVYLGFAGHKQLHKQVSNGSTISTMTCGTNLVPHQAAQGTPALCGNPAGDAGGCDFARLGDHDVARGVLLAVVVQDELGQLGGLAAACGSADYHHGVVFDEGNELWREEERPRTCACVHAVRNVCINASTETVIKMDTRTKVNTAHSAEASSNAKCLTSETTQQGRDIRL